MKNRVFGLLAIFIFSTIMATAQTKVIAHRGFWDIEGSAQNSIMALTEAYEIAAYGSEFDVLITKDGVPVVNHDDVFQGFDIQDTEYAKLRDLKLPNGETLPTLKDYLKQGKEYPEIQMILEIKPHKTKKSEDKAVALVVAMVKDLRMAEQVEYISFSLNICKELLKQNPTAQIAYLGGDLSPKEIYEIGLTGIDYHYSVFLDKNPDWIDEAKILGLTVNAWTVNKIEDMIGLLDKDIDFITTDKPLELQQLIDERE